MAEDFSNLFSKITKQRQLRKEDLRRKTAQAVGGTAATLRGESAPEAFAKRAPDYSKQMMTPQQKMLKRLELLKYQENLDQFYYGKEQDRYLKELNQEMQNRRALLQAETAKMREMGASARERARNMRLALSEDIDESVARGKRISTPSDTLKKVLSQVVPVNKLKTADEREANFLKQYSKLSASKKAQLNAKYKEVGGYQRVFKQQAEKEYQQELAYAQQYAMNAADTLMKEGNRDDIVNGIPTLSIMAQTTPEKLLTALGGNRPQVFSDLRINHAEEHNRLLDDIQVKQIERARASARTYGSSGGVGEAQNFLMTAPRSRMRVRALSTAQPSALSTARPSGPDTAIPEVVEEQEAAVSQQQQQPGFMGIPGVRMPETSQQRVLEMFNIIEKHPEHPPAKQAKMDIMQSEDLARYAKKFGPDAPMDKVFKEAARDARLKAKESNRNFRKKLAEKRLSESRAKLVKDRKPEVPVTGSDKGIGEKEDVGI
jgi:hypothetical protein